MSYVPMGGHEPSPTPNEPHTRPVKQEPATAWIIALLALPQLVQFPFGSLTLVPTLLIAAVTGVIGVAIAALDQRVLLANSHVRRTSPWLALLPIFYLGVRGSRRFDETGKGLSPFWIHLVIVIVVGFLLVWGPDGVMALLL